MNAALEPILHVAFTVAAVGLFAAMFVYGTWFMGAFRGKFDPRGRRRTDKARRHQARLLSVFVMMALAFGGMIVSSADGRNQFCRDAPIWPGCEETR